MASSNSAREFHVIVASILPLPFSVIPKKKNRTVIRFKVMYLLPAHYEVSCRLHVTHAPTNTTHQNTFQLNCFSLAFHNLSCYTVSHTLFNFDICVSLFRTNSLKRIKNAKWQVKDCPPELLLGDISRRLSTEVTPAAIAQNNRAFVEKLLKVYLVSNSYPLPQ